MKLVMDLPCRAYRLDAVQVSKTIRLQPFSMVFFIYQSLSSNKFNFWIIKMLWPNAIYETNCFTIIIFSLELNHKADIANRKALYIGERGFEIMSQFFDGFGAPSFFLLLFTYRGTNLPIEGY